MTGRKRVTWLQSEEHPGLPQRLGSPDAWLGAAVEAEPTVLLTRSRTTDTSVIDVPSLGRVIRKRWRWPGATERLKGVGRTTALARTPAEREFVALGRRYGGGSLFHPRPIAAWVEREGGFAHRAMLLLDEIADAVELGTFLRDEADPERRSVALDDLAARLSAMHAAGVTDGDCHPRNVLVDGARTWKIDCGRQRAGRATARGRRAVYDIACIDVGLVRLARDGERMRFLEAYVDASRLGDAGQPFLDRVANFRRRIESEESRRLPQPRDE